MSSSTTSSQVVGLLTIGTASHRKYNLGIKIPTFELSQKFANKYNLVQRKSISQSRPGGAVVKFQPKFVIDASWPVNAEKADFAIQSIVDCIGGALRSGKLVNIDFGIGVLVGENNVCR